MGRFHKSRPKRQFKSSGLCLRVGSLACALGAASILGALCASIQRRATSVPKPSGEPTWEEARPWVTAILIFYTAALIALGYALKYYGDAGP